MNEINKPIKYLHTCMHTCMHACIQTHIHPSIHPSIHTYMYIFCSRHNEAQVLRPSMNSECAPSNGEKEMRSHPAKSGPIHWPWCVTTICAACLRKSGRISHSTSVGWDRSVATKPLAKPAQKAGGYSLRIPVAHSCQCLCHVAWKWSVATF